ISDSISANSIDRDFSFESFASANDVELKLTEATDNPDSQVVIADDSNSTDGVVLLKGKLKAQGSDIEIKQLQISINSTSASTTTGDAGDIASQFILKIDGNEVDTVDSGDCENTAECSGSGVSTGALYNFDDVDTTINEDDT